MSRYDRSEPVMTVTFLKVESLGRGSRTVLGRRRAKSTVRTLREEARIALSGIAPSKIAIPKTALPRNAPDVTAYRMTKVSLGM